MGYSHYLYRPVSIKNFEKASAAIARCAGLLNYWGIEIVDSHGNPGSKPTFSESEILFNGSTEQGNGWDSDCELGLIWPKSESDTTEQWFGGNLSDRRVAPNKDGSYESLVIKKKKEISEEEAKFIQPIKDENWNYFDGVKTNYAPYDILVMVAYAAVRYYDRRCAVKTDGNRKQWAIAFEILSGVVEETPGELETLIFETVPEPNSPPSKKVEPTKTTPKFDGRTVKKHLKQHFPGVKFTAKKTFKNTIQVEWEDGFDLGATRKCVQRILEVFSAGYSDGCNYHVTQRICCQQKISPEWQEKLEKKFEQLWGKKIDSKSTQMRWEMDYTIELVYGLVRSALASDNCQNLKEALRPLKENLGIKLNQGKSVLVEAAKQILA